MSDDLPTSPDASSLTELTADIVSAMVSNNTVATDDLPTLITSVFEALSAIVAPKALVEAGPVYEPAVSIRKSLADPAKIISLIDGKPYSTLKRHLGQHGLTPAEYRERYGLPRDYPMIAPAYAERRREIAKTIGLGSKGRGSSKAEPAPEPVAEVKPAKGRRKKLGISATDALASARIGS